MEITQKLTLKQLLLIAHSLGIDLFNAVISLKRKDKYLPSEYYRNYFNTTKGSMDYEAIQELVKLGMMEEMQDNKDYFRVTLAGMIKFRLQYGEYVEYLKPHYRDLPYLKKRINFYCAFYNYNFGGNDNSAHILDEYIKYRKGVYVSHTTKDVIVKFKSEMARLHPNYSLQRQD